MNSQLYTAASGLILEQRRLDMISNNLANLSTAGFRAQRLFSTVYQRFDAQSPETVRVANAAVAAAGDYEVPGRGSVRFTQRDLDVALEDGTFLVVDTPAGRRYTRRGDLQRSPAGELVVGAGQRLVGSDGKPIQALGPAAVVAADGRIRDGENEVGRLKIVRDPAGLLRRVGNGLYTASGRDAQLPDAGETRLEPGWLEGSGTDPLGEMVRLIEAQRTFETYQKLVSTTMNEVNRRAVNDLAG